MRTSSRVAAALGALALVPALLPTLLPTATAYDAPPAAAPTVTVTREYGAGPVTLGNASVLKLRFHGRPGDRVRIDGARSCPLSLRGPEGVVARQASGFWRIADRGVQTFTLQRCRALSAASALQLTKLVVRSLAVDGAATVLRGRRGFVEAAAVRVPASGRVQVTPATSDGFFDALVLPGGYLPLGNGRAYFLEAGRPVSSLGGRLHGAGGSGTLVTQAGDRVLFLSTTRTVAVALLPRVVPVVVDAPTTLLPANDALLRQYQVEFDGVAGQWVHAEVGALATPYGVVLLGPSGFQLSRSFWRLPRTGRYRLMLPTTATSAPTSVRIRTIRQLPDAVPVDGTTVTFTAADPGEWVMAPMTLGTSTSALFYRLSAGTATTTGGWSALATGQSALHCPRSANGCGDWSEGTVSPTSPTSVTFGTASGLLNPWMVVLQMEPGTTGSVVLSVALSPTSN